MLSMVALKSFFTAVKQCSVLHILSYMILYFHFKRACFEGLKRIGADSDDF